MLYDLGPIDILKGWRVEVKLFFFRMCSLLFCVVYCVVVEWFIFGLLRRRHTHSSKDDDIGF